ncbi:MAG: hypothetical protein IJ062_11935 [Firmicutes bacterium]|nr:hypothetical protein [Bacillota bacterium]
MYYFLNPIASPVTDGASMLLIVLGVMFLIVAIVSVIDFALKSAHKKYEEKVIEQDQKESEKDDI